MSDVKNETVIANQSEQKEAESCSIFIEFIESYSIEAFSSEVKKALTSFFERRFCSFTSGRL